jgi:phage shock protein A
MSAARFEVIESTLRDLAQQLVVLGRAVKVAIEERRGTADRFDTLEQRVADLEKKVG